MSSKNIFGPATKGLSLCAREAFSREAGIAGFPRVIDDQADRYAYSEACRNQRG
jgi:hypothetical protein